MAMVYIHSAYPYCVHYVWVCQGTDEVVSVAFQHACIQTEYMHDLVGLI